MVKQLLGIIPRTIRCYTTTKRFFSSSNSNNNDKVKTNYKIHIPSCSNTITINKPYQCIRGGLLNNVQINYTRIGTRGKPIVFIMPSMSHSSYVADDYTHYTVGGSSSSNKKNIAAWWNDVVGYGTEYGIDLDQYEVICAAALGGPYGTTSPLSAIDNDSDSDTNNNTKTKLYRSRFPVITPADQANIHKLLLDELNIDRVHCVIGASMGGMGALQFAALHWQRYDRIIAIATTAHTSPSTVALRSTQRHAVILDELYNDGNYDLQYGPYNGMMLARRIGTIAYRSRDEFDNRFKWNSDSTTHRFDVENYLDYVSHRFSTTYDPNCYLTLSRCMDLMDIGYDSNSYNDGCKKIPHNKQIMLLPIQQDTLIPYSELTQLGSVLGQQGKNIHCEVLSSVYGHDSFLKESNQLNPRIHEFLSKGTSGVRQYVNSIFNW